MGIKSHKNQFASSFFNFHGAPYVAFSNSWGYMRMCAWTGGVIPNCASAAVSSSCEVTDGGDDYGMRLMLCRCLIFERINQVDISQEDTREDDKIRIRILQMQCRGIYSEFLWLVGGGVEA